ncbi:hypothetical protein PIB30_067047 [Stylosanthes scabra]|uniref:Uncharacterized protein n=1 Tax=Stylosanthes scabra TaxID=79078 RepID=A0ABU6TM70_9FABA|nr:hypothetical protein [Stylosanthes scabra]
MTQGDHGRGRGDRGRGSGGRRGRPKKRMGVPLDLGQDDPPPTQGMATLPPPVIPTPSLSESLLSMRMIPTPGSRVQSSDTSGIRGQTQTTASARTSSGPAHDHVDDFDAQPPPVEPDPMPFPPVNNLLSEGEEEDIAAEEAAAALAGRVYLRWDGANCSVRLQSTWSSFGGTVGGLQRGYELKIYESWRQRAAKRLQELFHEIWKKGAPHGWIPEDIFARLVEFWRQEDFKRL